MNDHYEPILIKCRALAALANPENGGADGERSNALNALKRLMKKHGITPEMLAGSNRTPATLICDCAGFKLSKLQRSQLASLARQIARYIVGKKEIEWDANYIYIEPPTRGLKVPKAVQFYQLTVFMTKLEADEWHQCYYHYAPDFCRTSQELARRARIAAKAKKMGFSAFINQFDIFPADEAVSSKLPSANEMAAMLAAQQGVHGESWQKKVVSLEGTLKLTA